ncbi:Metal-dependent phosphohydrolase [Rhynchospora pubera]|uniref:Metal-dependent phosphohydrolase n=1 Tax=Rhynchospora pubera TaxID=906938 RepID=A0AAV8E4U0_9POAL|nr:Metal-dependent phosphohydrolase [Rhynchospora pubera]KAJ4777421.1 Metal-dependent phosphohydrolase [Rhynchospora pubera]KAJ4784296.1 Metal-dependent phosphohydrolase [Rhynchospora pubera]
MEMEKGKSKVVRSAEKLVETAMAGRDASHDAAHAFRVRDLALSLASEEGLGTDPASDCDSLEIVELAALLHDIGDYKYMKNSVEDTSIVERFLEEEGLDASKREKILSIIKGMGFKNEVSQTASVKFSTEFGVVQDADRLDAIGAIGIARCFTYGGSVNQVLHDPSIPPRQSLSKDKYMNKNEKQTSINHFYEKLFKLKDLMKTEAGKRRAEKRHNFMQGFLREFYEEWEGKA